MEVFKTNNDLGLV